MIHRVRTVWVRRAASPRRVELHREEEEEERWMFSYRAVQFVLAVDDSKNRSRGSKHASQAQLFPSDVNTGKHTLSVKH